MMADKPVLLVTGSRKGIGRYLAEYYLARGYLVEGISRDPSDLADPNYRHHHGDVASEKDVRTMVADISKRHGRIDVVLNNAGIASMNHVLTTPVSTFNRIFEVNVTGTMLVSREVAKVMVKRRYGRIVNFASIAAPIALEGEAAYAASKAAVETFTRIMAFELGQWGITCNSFGATPIATDMIRSVDQTKIRTLLDRLAIKRLGTPQDCANVCDFFMRPESDNITGQTVYLGGIS
jgi:3-oxoacyl-[acyl-carrier protein] reductase